MKHFILSILFCLTAAAAFAQVEQTHQQWYENTFGDLRNFVRANRDINLLTFPGAKMVKADNTGNAEGLTDGEVGTYGGDGRVSINGKPSVIVFYLGKPQKIQELRIFSGNIDSRSNQDFEVRFANNEKNPGQQPNFPAEPTFTSGDKILGTNVGGYMSKFADKSGKPLWNGQQYDWVEFKLWQTYPSTAGEPAKAANKKSDSWASYLELQLLGDPNDPALFASEQAKAEWMRNRLIAELQGRLSAEVGEDVVAAMKHPESLKRAIDDLSKKYPGQYNGKEFTARYEKINSEGLITEKTVSVSLTREDVEKNYEKCLKAAKDFAQLRKDALLANPLLNFDKLLFRRSQNDGLQANWISNAARGKHAYGSALALVNPKDAQGDAQTVIEEPNGSFVGDICLHWNADKMLVTALSPADKTWQIFELGIDGSDFHQITKSVGKDVDNVEGCYIPDGSTVFISTANMMGVPCIDGSSMVGNIYRQETDGTVRQLTFEQDQDWCPTLLQNGKVLFSRWEYIDTPHYFTRLLFEMNPDGTHQVAYYGSNGFWPNSTFYAKPVPGSTTKVAAIISGHHGTARSGELILFDVQKGRTEEKGVIQRIPGYGKKVEPVITDQLVDDSWPKFLFPAPLDENYLIVSAKLTQGSPWALYLVDTFDNMLKIREEPGYGLFEPTPVIKRPQPQVRANSVEPKSKKSTVFVTDVYVGDGLKDVPKGTIKKFRVYELNYGYRGIGSHDYFGMESCWDARRMLGEVPVYEDGSVSFEIPPNTPLAIQPLDDKGRAVQLMRTWFVGMPGENQFCIGCHESQNLVTPSKQTTAMGKIPVPIQDFFGPARPFSYKYEVQPVLDRYCVGCHNGEKPERPNFADTKSGYQGYSNSYHALHRFVRRPGPEGDYHLLQPMEFHASTSELFVMLEKGHHGVKVDPDSMRRLYAWADMNVPYFGTWIEVAEKLNRKNIADTAARATELRSLYADIDFNPEAEPYAHLKLPEKIDWIPPQKVELDYTAPKVPNFPFNADTAKKMQETAARSISKETKQTVIVNDVSFDIVYIPAGQYVSGDNDIGFADELPRKQVEIKRPFWMAATEVTNQLYAQFDPQHDSRYIDQWCKDHTTPGYPANKPEQPVIRVNWNQAAEFCKWLSEKTGKKFRLPTEQEWEWACRAGAGTPMWYGNLDADFGKLENMADMQTKKFVVRGVNPQPINNPPDVEAFIPRAEGVDDGNMIEQNVGSYQTNPWGLFDMHGSVAEWTGSDYIDGSSAADARKVAKGGSWRDRPKWSRAGVRRAYQPYQPVFNVGIRVVCEE
ncbi:MAG: SUMF1/EgtB/PvdO family nonheme iron enzyme [Planctomycetaceae bacterium]|jgi:formylglycine-generating enzyme required for sulfatase activity|nr:SUMF1/EgtB/PvdO family nonheme iron enzyme [Planctomycetaceae bacterium]